MLKIRIIFFKEYNTIYDYFRIIFDDYTSVKIVVNNKIYTIDKNGVTYKQFNYLDYVDNLSYEITIPNSYVYNKAERFIKRQENKKYDYFGSTIGLLGFGFQDSNKWFDSEIITKFLQYCLFDDVVEYNASKVNCKELKKICEVLINKQNVIITTQANNIAISDKIKEKIEIIKNKHQNS